MALQQYILSLNLCSRLSVGLKLKNNFILCSIQYYCKAQVESTRNQPNPSYNVFTKLETPVPL